MNQHPMMILAIRMVFREWRRTWWRQHAGTSYPQIRDTPQLKTALGCTIWSITHMLRGGGTHSLSF